MIRSVGSATLVFFACLTGTTGCLVAPGEKATVDIDVGYLSSYVSRGMVQNENDVAQGSLAASFNTRDGGQLRAGTWGNLDLSNDTGDAWLPDGHGGKFSQIDLSLEYMRQFGLAGVGAGIISYVLPDGSTFPNGARGTTTETFVQVNTVLGDDRINVTPFARFNYDADEVDGYYIQAGLEGAVFLDTPVAPFDLHVGVEAGYADDEMLDWLYALPLPDSSFTEIKATAELSHQWVEQGTTFYLGGGYSTIIDDDLSDWFDIIGIDDENVWVTTGIRWRF